ncbi:unnamed protein product [Symbiodinium sp. CCMP2592]|nr:unnamed protein product [Symbiodinium sp. CCMP2592]
MDPTPARFEGMVHTLLVARASCALPMDGDLRLLEYLLVRMATIPAAMLWQLLEARADVSMIEHERLGLVSPLGMAVSLGLSTESSILLAGACKLLVHLIFSLRRCQGSLCQHIPAARLEAVGTPILAIPVPTHPGVTMQPFEETDLEGARPTTMALADVRSAGLCLHADPAGSLFCRWLSMGTRTLARMWPVPVPLARCPGFLGHRDFLQFLEPLVGVPMSMLRVTDSTGRGLVVDNPRSYTRTVLLIRVEPATRPDITWLQDKLCGGDLSLACFAQEQGWPLDGRMGWEPHANALVWAVAHAGLALPALLRHFLWSPRRSQLLRPLLRTWMQGVRAPPAASSTVAYLLACLDAELREQLREILMQDLEGINATAPRWLVDMMWYGAAPWPPKLYTVLATHMLWQGHYQYVGWLLAAGADDAVLRHRASLRQPASGEEPAVMPKHAAAHLGVRAWGAPQWGRLVQCLPSRDGFTNDSNGIVVRGNYQLQGASPRAGSGVWGPHLCPVAWALDQPVVVLTRVLEVTRERQLPGGGRLREALDLAAQRGDTLQVAILVRYLRMRPVMDPEEDAEPDPVHLALLTAVQAGSAATVYELLAAGYPAEGPLLKRALIEAVEHTAPLAVSRLLLIARADPGLEPQSDDSDYTPFGLAVFNRMWDTVRLFLCNSIAHRPGAVQRALLGSACTSARPDACLGSADILLGDCQLVGDSAAPENPCVLPCSANADMAQPPPALVGASPLAAGTDLTLRLQARGTTGKWEALGAGLNIPHYDVLQLSTSSAVDAPFVQYAHVIAALYDCNVVVIEASRRLAWLKAVPGDPRVAASGITSYHDSQGHRGYQAFYHT